MAKKRFESNILKGRDGITRRKFLHMAASCAVAAPVRDQLGTVIATLSVVVPTGRFGPEERRRCAEAVKAAAASLSGFLGYSPPKTAPGAR